MKIFRLIKQHHSLKTFAVFITALFFVSQSSITVKASAPVFPYTKTFTITAYYSPLPDQETYATGAYETDIILNGQGTHGADGTAVYPGMIAAPSSYAFGTKMEIPGVGVVAVHDRGGAIVEANERNNEFDRLDIWMGHGEEGLQRALEWGKRTLEVTVHGLNSKLEEKVNWKDLKPTVDPKSATPVSVSNMPGSPGNQHIPTSLSSDLAFSQTLELGAKNDDVHRLQKELHRLHLLGVESTGYYGELTQHAVFKFQQINGLVGDKDSPGAGVFGPKTRQKMNEIVAQRVALAALRKG